MSEAAVTASVVAAVVSGILIAFATDKSSGEGARQAAALTSKLASSHYLLPAELVGTASAVEKALRNLLTAVIAREKDKLSGLNGAILESLNRHEEAARTWRDKSRAALLEGVRTAEQS